MNKGGAPVAVFVGTTPNIGTTASAFAVAMRLAELSGKPVGYLCLHLKSAKLHRYLGVDAPVASLDTLQPELRSASLTPGTLLNAMHTLPDQTNLQVLFGSMSRERAEFYSMEDIGHLLDVAGRTFDFVVADVGAYWDNAATICAVQRADSRLLVTTGALSHFQEDGNYWIGQMSPLFDVDPGQYACIVARCPWNGGGFSLKQICREMGVAPSEEFHMKESLFGSLDQGSYHQWLREETCGRTALKETAQALLQKYEMGATGDRPVGGPWLRRLLGRGKEVGVV